MPVASKVEVANLALTKLGDEPILLLTDDTKPARTLNRIFDLVADAEMQANWWKFTVKRTELSALAVAPAWGYQFQYPLPADYLGLVQVNEFYCHAASRQQTLWSIEAGRLLTNLPAPLKLRYVSRAAVAAWHPLFVDAFACKLAMEACETLTQSDSKFQRLAKMYELAINRAHAMDAIENPPEEFPLGSWNTSREGDMTVAGGQDWQAFPSGVVVG